MNPTETEKTTGTTTPPGEREQTTEPTGTAAGSTGTVESADAGSRPTGNAGGHAHSDSEGAEGAGPAGNSDPAGPSGSSGPMADDGPESGGEPEDEDGLEDDGRLESDGDSAAPRVSSGLLSAAAGVIAAGLGVVSLSGTWVGRVAAERRTLIGQLETSQGSSPAEQISAIYGDAWHTTAFVNGIFAFVALLIGVAVLTRPRKPGWVRAFAVAGTAFGGLGLLVSLGMYFDLLLSLPSAGS
ncbi:hypothetical protein ACIBCM_31710 [Streptomyces sp. NPDC051018]|uniref:hypothetical protein n=1 Tax=Streptomyces sp. NPDC051018 TaxID=3365639 RepID=UPI00379A7251